jgi:O-antigen/teichoic acid export membrane protein
MAAIKRALLLSTCDRYFGLITNFATVAILSRILAPAEIGVSVIGMAIIAIAMSAKEFASGSFLIQRENLSREEIRAAFTIMLLLTLAIAATLALAAPRLAAAYGEENLVPYLHVVSVSLLVELASSQILSLLRRDMAFGKIAIISMSSTAAGSLSSISLALLGFSYMSFAWAWLAGVSVAGLVALFLCPHFWMFKPSFSHWRGMAAFGGYNGATVVLFKSSEALPYLILGRMVSPDAAALLSRANMICQLPDKTVLGGAISVILPAFATEVRQGRTLKAPYLKSVELLTALQWPALVVLAVLAYPVVDILLGHQWRGVAPLVQIIAMASLFTFCFELNYSALVAMGAMRDIFRRALIVCPVSAAIVAVGAFLGGLQGVAWSSMLIIPFHAFVSWRIVRRRISLRWADIVAATWRSGTVAAASAIGPLAATVAAGMRFDLSVSQGIFAGGLAVVGWLTGLLVTRHPLLEEIANAVPVVRRAWPARNSMASALSKD